MPVQCYSCNQIFPDYKELALHISSSRKGHRKGKRWAAKVLVVNGLSGKQKHDGGRASGLTEEQKEAKKDTVRELSGRTATTQSVCPRCHHRGVQTLSVEFVENDQAWRISGAVVVMCPNC